jgi:hypothetical protein
MTEIEIGRVETILEVGAEGGSITMRGRRDSRGAWKFHVSTSEAALLDLLDGEAPGPPPMVSTPEGVRWIDSWDGALADLGRYPWPKLRPLAVHPEFARVILDAVTTQEGIGAREVKRWRTLIASSRSRPIVRDLSFEAWTSWARCGEMRTLEPFGGVYLFAYFNSPPPPQTAPDPQLLPFEVIYVGDAKDLNNRPLADPGHKVVQRLRSVFAVADLDCLYVTVGRLYTIDRVPRQYAYQRTCSFFLEAKLAWEYAQLHGNPPIFQVKDSAFNRPWIDQVVANLKRLELEVSPWRHTSPPAPE